MNKRAIFLLTLLLCLCCILPSCSVSGKKLSISDKLIRFHVIANSDSPEDQALKLKVRDKVLKEIGPEMEKYEEKSDSEVFLNQNIELIKNTAQKEIAECGKDYNVAVELGKSWFPTKVYSNIALPAGEYDALKVVIGKGEGKNWWCVMFPPLCFVDITHGVTDKATEDELKMILDDEEYKSLLTNAPKSKQNEVVKKPVIDEKSQEESKEIKTESKVEMKFKSVEVAQSLWARLEKLFNSENR